MLQVDVLPVNTAAHRFSEKQGATLCRSTHPRDEEDSLGLRLSVCDLADEDGILRVADVTLFLHVGGGDGEHGAVVIEGKGGDTGRVPVELAQALLVERVPDVHEAVRATWAKGRVKVKLKRFRMCWDMDL